MSATKEHHHEAIEKRMQENNLKQKKQMPKRMFEILDKINQHDVEQGTRLVAISNTFISADKVKRGTKICMGADEQSLLDIISNKVIPILVLVDKEEYQRIKNNQ